MMSFCLWITCQKLLVFKAVRACFLEAQNNNDLPIEAQNNNDLPCLPIVVQPSEARNNDNSPVPIEPVEEKNENQILYTSMVMSVQGLVGEWKERLNFIIIIFTQHF